MDKIFVSRTINILYLINSVIFEDTRNVIMSSSFSNATIIQWSPYMLSGIFLLPTTIYVLWLLIKFRIFQSMFIGLFVCLPYFFNFLNLYYVLYCLSQFACMNSSSFLKKDASFSVYEIAFIPNYCYELRISL